MDMRRNIRIFNLYKMFTGAIIIGPVIIIYLLDVKGLSFTQAMLLSTVSAISMVLFEVPTGAVADRWGRRQSLIIGSLIIALSLLLYVAADSFLLCMAAEILFSLGFAFNSGADTALLYDSLAELGEEDRFAEVAGQAQSLLYWVQAVGCVAAGFLYEWNVHLPLIISALFIGLSALVVIMFREPSIHRDGQEREGYFSQVRTSAVYVARHKKLRALILYIGIFFVFYRMGFPLFQPYMVSVGIPVRYIGVIFFLFNFTAGYVSRHSHRLMKLTGRRTLMFLSSLLIVSFALLGSIGVWYGSLAILLQQVARGLYNPISRKYFNKHIPSEIRATVLSFISLILRLATAAAFPLLGMVRDNYSIATTHWVLFGTMVIFTAFGLYYIRDKLGVAAPQVD